MQLAGINTRNLANGLYIVNNYPKEVFSVSIFFNRKN